MSRELMGFAGKLLGLALLVSSTFLAGPSVRNAEACCSCDYSQCYTQCYF